MFSLDNGDLRLALQRGITYVDALAAYSPTLTKWTLGDLYGSVVVGGFIYAAVVGTSPGKVRKINPADGSIVLDITVGNDPRGMCYDGTNIWCCNYNPAGPGTTVSKINPANDTVTATVTVGNRPVMVEADGSGHVWVACTGSSSAYKINISTNAVTVIPLGFAPGALAFDNRGYMVFGGSYLKRVRITTNAVTYLFRGFTYGMCSAAGFIWWTNFDRKIFRLDRMTNKLATVFSPVGPTRRPAFDGKRVWVPCGDSERTVVVDVETLKVVANIAVGSGSNKSICFDATNAYISAGNDLVKVPLA